jgi:hypothetical protein
VEGRPRPDLGYSEHAYGNADDWMINGYGAQKPYVDMLGRMRSEGYPVGTVLWYGSPGRTDHRDHIHIEGDPKLDSTGKPPCAGGNPIQATGTTTGEVTEESVHWWDWVLDPAGAATTSIGNALGEIIPRIAFGILALVVVVILANLLVKALAKETGIVDIVKGAVA